MKLLSNKCWFCWFVLLLTTAVSFPLIANEAVSQDDPVTHKVSVDVMLVPIFARGVNGEPVFDLKKEDFELYANGTQFNIDEFIRFDFGQLEEITEEETEVELPTKKRVKQPSRAVFIIIDSVFNSVQSFRRSKQIAIDLINEGSPDDMFIILENTAAGGPRHIAGPDSEKEKLIQEIKKLRLPSNKWDKNLHLTREWDILNDSNMYDPVFVAASMENLHRQNIFMDQMAYKNQAHHFSRFLARFKYALKTITRPKVLFLISEGIASAAFKTLESPEVVEAYGRFHSAFTVDEKGVDKQNEFRDQRLFKDLQQVVKAINEGGSVLYTVNPERFQHDSEASGEMSMRFLAQESGGEYIAGSDVHKIIKTLKKTTAAYYELVFSPSADLDAKEIDIEVKCKRKGVIINTFKKTERNHPYFKMEQVEKKLFALNMVTGGSWSRMMGKVVRIKYNRLRSEKIDDETVTMIEIPLPDKMKSRSLDIFAIKVDSETKKVNIELINHKAKDRVNLIVKQKPKTREFFVIIEPVFAYCIYNQL
jgi:VWFA-related protein